MVVMSLCFHYSSIKHNSNLHSKSFSYMFRFQCGSSSYFCIKLFIKCRNCTHTVVHLILRPHDLKFFDTEFLFLFQTTVVVVVVVVVAVVVGW